MATKRPRWAGKLRRDYKQIVNTSVSCFGDLRLHQNLHRIHAPVARHGPARASGRGGPAALRRAGRVAAPSGNLHPGAGGEHSSEKALSAEKSGGASAHHRCASRKPRLRRCDRSRKWWSPRARSAQTGNLGSADATRGRVGGA